MQPTKMRIRCYASEDGKVVSDRLVEQATELRIGPKEPWNGPMTLEFNLSNQQEVDSMIEYIKKLKGDLPIVADKQPKTKTAKTIDKMLSDKEPLLDLLKTLKAKAKNQEDLITMLREYNFRFLATHCVNDFGGLKKQIKIKEKHQDYQWMVRLVKEAKVPENDKWDFRLAFGIKFMGDKVDRVQVYLWGEWKEKWSLAWKDKEDINFKKVEQVFIFPEFMEDYAERKKWRQEHRKVLRAAEKGEEYEPSKFYTKWKPYIKGL